MLSATQEQEAHGSARLPRLVDASPAPAVPTPHSAAPAIWKGAAAYTAAVLASLVLMTGVLKLWHFHLHVPLCYTWDSLLCQMWIKGVIEHGWYLENPDLGAPFSQESYDFPLADNLHFAALKLLGYAFPDAGAVYNLYYLLTFPVTTLTMLYALRRFRISYAVSIVVSLLFTFLPLHFHRLIHYLLACYYVVPLMGMVILQVYMGQYHARRDEAGDPEPRWRLLVRWLVALGTCILTGMAGIYYAFFACFFLLIAGIAGLCSSRRWAALGAGLLLTLTVCGSVGGTLFPSIRYKHREGSNGEAVRRGYQEAEVYGLRITQLLLPVTGHRVPWLLRFKNYYNATAPLFNENDFATLGALGSVGFLLLVGWLVLRPRVPDGSALLDGLSVCNAAALLLATLGGFGSLFTYLTTPYIRGYNRISVYIGFFALSALAVVLDRTGRRWASTTRRRLVFWTVLVVLLFGGVADQTTPLFVPAYARWHQDYREDEEFVRRIEAAVPAGTMVYQLPYVQFPEEGPTHDMVDYDSFRPYLHSHMLRWSYGAMRERPGDAWHRDLLTRPLAERLSLLALAGFGGVHIDRAGYADHAAALEADLASLLGVKPLVSSGERFAFFDMAPYNLALRRQFSEEDWQRRREAVLHPVTFRWLGTFHNLEGSEAGGLYRVCSRSGQVEVTNPFPQPRRVTVQMTCTTHVPGNWHLDIEGTLWRETVPVRTDGHSLTKGLTVPPGTHVLRFTCDAPLVPLPDDRRPVVFRVVSFTCREEF
jgi:phosphoglycerol transferase